MDYSQWYGEKVRGVKHGGLVAFILGIALVSIMGGLHGGCFEQKYTPVQERDERKYSGEQGGWEKPSSKPEMGYEETRVDISSPRD